MQLAQGRRFNLGFFQDMGDASDVASAGASLETVGRMELDGAALAARNGQDPTGLEIAAINDRNSGLLLNPDVESASVSPSGSQTSQNDVTGKDFLDAFGATVNAAGRVAPAIAGALPKKYAAFFGNATPQPKPKPASTVAGVGVGTVLVVGVGIYLLTRKGGSSRTTTKTTTSNPKKKGKKSKGKKKSGKRKGSKKSSGKKRKSSGKKRGSSGKKRSGKSKKR